MLSESSQKKVDFANEVWRDIEGYEGKYQVSNMGRVKSLPKQDGFYQIKHERILKPIPTKNGYLRVHLRNSSKQDIVLIHRLVAMLFVKNPNGFKVVNHKDENKFNNRADNLEWCTHVYNVNYGTGIKRRTEKFRMEHSRSVDMFDLNGNYIRTYDCMRDVRNDGFSPSNVFACCVGRYKQHHGYKWRYSNR